MNSFSYYLNNKNIPSFQQNNIKNINNNMIPINNNQQRVLNQNPIQI